MWTIVLVPELSEEDCKSYEVFQYAPFCQIMKCSHCHSLTAQTLSTPGKNVDSYQIQISYLPLSMKHGFRHGHSNIDNVKNIGYRHRYIFDNI